MSRARDMGALSSSPPRAERIDLRRQGARRVRAPEALRALAGLARTAEGDERFDPHLIPLSRARTPRELPRVLSKRPDRRGHVFLDECLARDVEGGLFGDERSMAERGVDAPRVGRGGGG